jgi:hypothetical protein
VTRPNLDLRWKKLGSIREENAWPGGPKRLPCLGCDQMFTSTAKDHRMCGECAVEE